VRQLPVIQPEAQTPSPAPSEMRTAGIVNDPARLGELRPRILDAIKTVFDPEIPVNIYDLGLIYTIDIDADHNVEVRMTLTAPACPVADKIVADVASRVRGVEGVKSAKVNLVFDPPWTKERMSEAALLELGLL